MIVQNRLNTHAVLVALSFLTTFLLALPAGQAISQEVSGEFKPIFNGTSLEGWVGDENFWRVENGAIVGETTPDKKLKANSFLVWNQGEVDDFELRLKFRIHGDDTANSGIQFRSQQGDKFSMSGYQADIHRGKKYLGIIYSEKTGRGILAQRGTQVSISTGGKAEKTQVTETSELDKAFKVDDWNDYLIRCHGNQIKLMVNGVVTAELEDNDAKGFARKGKIGLQVHVGKPFKVEFKDIQLKRLPLANEQKKVVFVAGGPSHRTGDHEHNAGCMLMQKLLGGLKREDGRSEVVSTKYWKQWPSDPTAFDNADTVVIYCDGGGRHFLNRYADSFEDTMRRGTGLICVHYGVEVPKGPTGDRLLGWIGGYFETHWSVNPHWTAKFETLPKHPVTQGVEPFELNDEWYYHMRFVPEMSRVTPILSALPPKESLSRGDGPHSGNPDVRKAVLEDKRSQHVAWAFVRGDGKGRGFGFTGGHFHKTWQNDQARKLLLNAIYWTAHLDVPENGIDTPTPTDDEMMENLDGTPDKVKRRIEKQKREKEKLEKLNQKK